MVQSRGISDQPWQAETSLDRSKVHPVVEAPITRDWKSTEPVRMADSSWRPYWDCEETTSGSPTPADMKELACGDLSGPCPGHLGVPWSGQQWWELDQGQADVFVGWGRTRVCQGGSGTWGEATVSAETRTCEADVGSCAQMCSQLYQCVCLVLIPIPIPDPVTDMEKYNSVVDVWKTSVVGNVF